MKFSLGMQPLVVLALVLAAAVAHAGDLRTLLTKRCLACHDNSTKQSDLSLEALSVEVTSENAAVWLKVLEQIELGNMPPADEEQPSAEERHSAVLELEGQLVAQAKSAGTRQAAILRRLNRTEYRNTVGDLLHLTFGLYDPTSEFPDDARVQGFASVGEKLVTSSFLMRQYLEAADELIERAVHFEPRPEVQQWELRPPFDRTTGGFIIGEAGYFREVSKVPQPHQSICERMRDLPKGGYHPLDELRDGVPVAGWYKIRIQAEAKFRYANLDPKKMRFPSMWDSAQPLRLSLSTCTLAGIDPEDKDSRNYAAQHYQLGQQEVATWDLPDDQPTWLECRAWLDKGDFPRLGFPNGPSDSNNRLLNYFLDNKETLLDEEGLKNLDVDMKKFGHWDVFNWFESPRIRVSKIEIEGPLNDNWPPESHRAIFGDEPYHSDRAADVLRRFATRAWRRPAGQEEVTPLVHLVSAAEAAGATPEAAIREGLKAILASPDFLYREERGESLSGHEIASRLSYFLWSSTPDDELQKLAESGDLNRPAVRRAQAERLLADRRSESFVDEFLAGWLAMRKLGTMAPDVHKFSAYYDDDLEAAMRLETRLFFRQLLNTNGPIEQFLDSRYALVNRELARLYGIDVARYTAELGKPIEGLSPDDLVPDGQGNAPSLGFARVPLTDERRGGLLGQASILTLSANGVDTSPVVRGVWILEHLLGTPPPPPPPNVPAIEPDIRGAKTVREQLDKHRASEACAICHRQIDPPGFALETFDPIGRWRGHYQLGAGAVPIDSSGRFGATEFKDVGGLKHELLNRREQFARGFGGKTAGPCPGTRTGHHRSPARPPDCRDGRRRWLSFARHCSVVRRERVARREVIGFRIPAVSLCSVPSGGCHR